MKILFFTEAGNNIGYGHIARCFSLYQAFELKGFHPQIIVKSDVDLQHIVPEGNLYIFDWTNNSSELKNVIELADIAIFDSYLAAPNHILELAKEVKTPVFIDDFQRMTYSKGLVLNGAISAEKLSYPKNENIKYLLGASFQPIRKEFWNCPSHSINTHVTKIFITVGGNDIHGILPKLITNLNQLLPNSKLEVVCGDNSELEKWAEQQSDTEISVHTNLSASEMKSLMQKCDIAVSAAGQTLYELAATGLPTIGFSVADNQNINLKGWTDNGFILNAGICTESDFIDKIGNCVHIIRSIDFRQKASISGKKIINGEGGVSTVNNILRYHIKKHIQLQKARETDVEDIYSLSNEPSVRANSFNQKVIEYQSHVEWYQKKIADPLCLYLVAFVGQIFAGQVRYQVEGDSALIGVSIERNFRGYALGEIIVSNSCDLLKKNYPYVKEIVAYVKKENPASGKMFLKAGYIQIYNPESLEYRLTF